MNDVPGHPDNPVLLGRYYFHHNRFGETQFTRSTPAFKPRPLTYLACPYSHPLPLVSEWRYEQATKAAAWLLFEESWNVFSPITHSHPLHILGGCPVNWEFWKQIDTEYLGCSERLVVLLLEGWRESVGVTAEIRIANQMGIEVKYLCPTSAGDYYFVSDPDSVEPLSMPVGESPKCQESQDETPEPRREKRAEIHSLFETPMPYQVGELRGCVKVPEGMDNPKDLVGMTKPPLRLVPGALLLHCARVMALGAKKYGPYNWREKAVRYTVYLEAAMRHLISALDGEEIDHESKEPHIAHVAACMGILLDAQSLGKRIDDRPIPGKSAELIKQMTEKT